MSDLGKKVQEALEKSPAGRLVNGNVHRLKNPRGEYPAITFFFMGIRGDFYGDGGILAINHPLQVDIWTKESFAECAAAVALAMEGIGAVWEEENEFYEDDTGIYHKAIRFNLTEYKERTNE